MNVKQANFEDILERYYTATAAPEIVAHVQELGNEADQAYFEMLTHFEPPYVGDLFAFLEVVEIATLIDFIPIQDWTSKFWTDIGKVLEAPGFVSLCNSECRQSIADVVRYRIQHQAQEAVMEADPSFMMQFIHLDLKFRAAIKEESYLDLMSWSPRERHIWRSTENLESLLSALGNPEVVVSGLLVEPKMREPIDMLIASFFGLYDFCASINKVIGLAPTELAPLIYQRYRERMGKNLGVVLSLGRAEILKWKSFGDLDRHQQFTIDLWDIEARENIYRLTGVGSHNLDALLDNKKTALLGEPTALEQLTAEASPSDEEQQRERATA